MIKNLQMLDKEFKGQRTAYSSSSIFIAILGNSKGKYDHEVIGQQIFPNGFGCIEPPGPSFGFGPVYLTKDEENGKIKTKTLGDRKDDDGNAVSLDQVKSALMEYMDGFFRVDGSNKVIVQITAEEFMANVRPESDFDFIHLVEFEPEDEDFDEDEDS